MKTLLKILMFIGFAVVTAAASANVVTGKNGMTLYSFDKDSGGKSACADQCLAVWPAAKPGDASGKDFGEITRDDGSKQLTYKGKPLYYFASDAKPGDKTGDNLDNVWHVVPAKGAKKSESGSSDSSSKPSSIPGY